MARSYSSRINIFLDIVISITDIFLFIQKKKLLFGNDFTEELVIPNERIIIRILEIKNGFYEIKSDQESGNQRDLKIIQEIIVLDLEISFYIECQVNLENLIIQKKTDHTLQDFFRAKEEYEIVKQQQDRQEWMEGEMRIVLQIIRVVFILIAIVSFGISLSIILNDINLKLKTIWHSNLNIQVLFIEGQYPNNICYSIDHELLYCIGDTKISHLIKNTKFKKFKKLKSNGSSLIGIDQDQKIQNQNLIEQQDINIKENIQNIKQNINLICQSTYKNINCNHKIIYPNVISSRIYSYCISANDQMDCQGAVSSEFDEIPIELKSGVNSLAINLIIACAIRLDLFLCWGLNREGLLDIPNAILSMTVQIFDVGSLNVCAGSNQLIYCWGADLSTSERVESDVDINLNEIPAAIASGAELIRVGFANACGVKTNKLICWGWNLSGINDIPSEYRQGVTILAFNDSQVCAQNVKLKCWGADNYNISSLPAVVSNAQLDLVSMSMNTICVGNDQMMKCWGDGQGYMINQIPEYYFLGVDQIAVGQYHLCASINNKVGCYGAYQNFDISIPESMTQNWNLPSLQYNLSFVYNCHNIICVYKGFLYCQSVSQDNSIRSIDIPIEMMQNSDIQISESEIICGINNGKLFCWNLDLIDDKILYGTPDVFNSQTELVSPGWIHICASNASLIICWGSNGQGQTDIPMEMSGIILLTARGFSTCAGTSSKLVCWGSFYLHNTQILNEVPESLSSGVDKVEVGFLFACALKNAFIFCWGSNVDGGLDIPGEFSNGDVELIALGSQHACAQVNRHLMCWGSLVEKTVIPKQVENGLDRLNSCYFVNCGVQNGEWVCWGGNGIPQRLSVVEQFTYPDVNQFEIKGDYNICLNYDDYIECRSNTPMFERQNVQVRLEKSFMCMYFNVDLPQICQVDALNLQRFSCITANSKNTNINTLEQIGDSSIAKLSCGKNHGCALYQSGEVHCFGGSKEQDEANLPQEMMTGVYDIRSGQNSTCILNSTQIICVGKDIDRNKDEQLLQNLNGLDQIVKFN